MKQVWVFHVESTAGHMILKAKARYNRTARQKVTDEVQRLFPGAEVNELSDYGSFLPFAHEHDLGEVD